MMKAYCSILILFFVFYSTEGLTKERMVTLTSLSDYKWKNRLLLVYSSSADVKDQVLKQMAMFDRNDKENIDRNLILVSFNKTTIDSLKLQIEKKDFLVLLIGKDGGVKNLFQEPTKMSKIYNIIDSMPMRMDEMNQKD